MGTENDDELTVSEEFDTFIDGRGGNDIIRLGEEANVVDAGPGDDTIYNESGGSAYYVFEQGDGNDVIVTGPDNRFDVLEFGVGIVAEDITFESDGLDLIINLDEAGRLQISDYWSLPTGGPGQGDDNKPIDELRFADGSVVASQELQSLTENLAPGPLTGTPGATIYGTGSADFIDTPLGGATVFAGGGDDVIAVDYEGHYILDGGPGDDIYFFDQNFAFSAEIVGDSSGRNFLVTEGGNSSHFHFGRAGNDLIIQNGGWSPSVRSNLEAEIGLPPRILGDYVVRDYFANPDSIERFAFLERGWVSANGYPSVPDVLDASKYWTPEDVEASLVSDYAWGMFLRSYRTDETLVGTSGSDYLYVWGNDVAIGGAGSDYYYFDGHYIGNSVVEDNGGGGDRNVLAARAWRGMSHSLEKDGNDLLILVSVAQGAADVDGGEGSGGGGEGGEGGEGSYVPRSGTIRVKEFFTNPDDPAFQMLQLDQGTQPIEYSYSDVLSLFGIEDDVVDIPEPTIELGAGNDDVDGTDEDDVFAPSTGNDTMRGSAGNDTFLFDASSTGSKRIIGGEGNDRILATEADATIGLSRFVPEDSVELIQAAYTGATLSGSSANNTLDFSATTLTDIERIDGGAGNDMIVGSEGDDTIVGGTGNDNLQGGGGDDTFVVEGSSQGSDRIGGGDGFDRIVGGEDGDTITLSTFSPADSVEEIDGGGDFDRIVGTSANNTLDFSTTLLTSIEQIDGGAGNDSITGSEGDDIIVGGAGNDTLHGGGGDDTFIVEGNGQGSDHIRGGEGFDRVIGGEADDRITLSEFSAGNGIEQIDGGAGLDVISATSANNTLDFSGTTLISIDRIEGGAGNDVITGSAQADIIAGGSGNDELSGGGGDDTFLVSGVSDGNDTFDGGEGFDSILGTSVNDRFSVSRFTPADSVERIDGDLGENTIAGTSANNTLDFSGTELVNISLIDGAAGNDLIVATSGNDVILGGTGNDTLQGGAGDDTFLVRGTGDGNDTFDGGAGIDIIRGSSGSDRITLSSLLVAHSIEFIDGDGGADVVAGTSANNTLDFSATTLLNISAIEGGAGNDSIIGSALSDRIVGGTGNDTLSGGAGNDTFVVEGTTQGSDRIYGDAGTDTILGSALDDSFNFSAFLASDSVEQIDGGLGTNVVAGTSANNTLDFSLTAMLQVNEVNGRAGNDSITGSSGSDNIRGGAGNDSLSGGSGSDNFLLASGDGDDVLRFDAADGLSSDTLYFEGVSFDSLWFTQVGTDLRIDWVGGGESIRVQDWFGPVDSQLDRLVVSGMEIDANGINTLVTEMAVYNLNGASLGAIPADVALGLETAFGLHWQPSLASSDDYFV